MDSGHHNVERYDGFIFYTHLFSFSFADWPFLSINYMALPHLIKYVYTNGTDEVIRRGKKIHAIGYVELIEYDELFESVTFRVKDDSYATYYKVYVQKFKDPKSLSIRCSCPYNLGDICRHEAGALIQLQELLDRNML